MLFDPAHPTGIGQGCPEPRFNIVLPDDKSCPWLTLTEDHSYPQIAEHRGAQLRRGPS